MSELDPATPAAIDRVERARAADGFVRLRLSGRWLGSASVDELDALLVVHSHGRRHRFRPDRAPSGSGSASGAQSRADSGFVDFSVPDWAVPQQPGQASLWVGPAVVPVPPPGAPVAPPAESSAPLASPADPPEPRSGEAFGLRRALAESRAELERQRASAASLETVHGELRAELGRLVAAVEEQQAEHERNLERTAALEGHIAELLDEDRRVAGDRAVLREQLAAAHVSRDAARSEVAGLQFELERLGSELAVAREREHETGPGGKLLEAQQLLAEARALSERLRGGEDPT